MSNILFLGPVSDEWGMTMSASEEAASVDNLTTLQPYEKWSTSTDEMPYIEVDLGSSRSFDTVFLGYTNLVSGSTFRVRTATSQANLITSPDYDSGILSISASSYAEPHCFLFNPLGMTSQWLRIDIDNTGEGHVEAGRLLIGAAFQPERNIKTGWSLEVIPESEIQHLPTGPRLASKRYLRRQFSCNLGYQSAREMYDNIMPLLRTYGDFEPLLINIDPGDSDRVQDYTLYGVMVDDLSISNVPLNFFEIKMVIEELLGYGD